MLVLDSAELSTENNCILQENEKLKIDLLMLMENKMKKDAELISQNLVQDDMMVMEDKEETTVQRSRSSSRVKKDE